MIGRVPAPLEKAEARGSRYRSGEGMQGVAWIIRSEVGGL